MALLMLKLGLKKKHIHDIEKFFVRLQSLFNSKQNNLILEDQNIIINY